VCSSDLLLLAASLLCEQALAAGPALREQGLINTPELQEVSGIATSRLKPDRWWVHNDSGGGALLFEVDGSTINCNDCGKP
jgi:hypothetical protein